MTALFEGVWATPEQEAEMPVSDLVLTFLLASTTPFGGHGPGGSLAADSITQPNGGAMAPADAHFQKGKVVSPSAVRFHKGGRIVRAHKGGRIGFEHKGGRFVHAHKGGLIKPKV